MKITKQWLEERYAIKEWIEWFINQKENKGIKLIEKSMNYDAQFSNWILVRMMNYEQYVSYAIHTVEMALPIFEKKNPNDKRPRKAIELTKKYLKNQSQENKDIAYATYEGALDNNYGSSIWFYSVKVANDDYGVVTEIVESCCKVVASSYNSPCDLGNNTGKTLLENIKWGLKMFKEVEK